MFRSVSLAARRLARRFARARRGVVSVEFAMLAPMFLLVVFSIFEVSLISLAKSGMQAGLSDTARLVRTGQGVSLDADEAIERVCALAFVPNCRDAMTVEQERFPFGVAGGAVTADEICELGADEIVLMRVRYAWTVVTPILRPFLGDANGERELVASMVFKNEGFGNGGC